MEKRPRKRRPIQRSWRYESNSRTHYCCVYHRIGRERFHRGAAECSRQPWSRRVRSKYPHFSVLGHLRVLRADSYTDFLSLRCKTDAPRGHVNLCREQCAGCDRWIGAAPNKRLEDHHGYGLRADIGMRRRLCSSDRLGKISSSCHSLRVPWNKRLAFFGGTSGRVDYTFDWLAPP